MILILMESPNKAKAVSYSIPNQCNTFQKLLARKITFKENYPTASWLVAAAFSSTIILSATLTGILYSQPWYLILICIGALSTLFFILYEKDPSIPMSLYGIKLR